MLASKVNASLYMCFYVACLLCYSCCLYIWVYAKQERNTDWQTKGTSLYILENGEFGFLMIQRHPWFKFMDVIRKENLFASTT
ncbi:hypothetical protein CDL12_13207 [Handroanthus impetiginosus]|uniref:Uncharacterized protein n=1 Tax=Handroanthus impetiginosus TaxID=429701 RepID=A0A2G9H9H7_9LAMI|nr:hypothetical protein CDL12_13207 [Handroanthus impetiginosus]